MRRGYFVSTLKRPELCTKIYDIIRCGAQTGLIYRDGREGDTDVMLVVDLKKISFCSLNSISVSEPPLYRHKLDKN